MSCARNFFQVCIKTAVPYTCFVRTKQKAYSHPEKVTVGPPRTPHQPPCALRTGNLRSPVCANSSGFSVQAAQNDLTCKKMSFRTACALHPIPHTSRNGHAHRSSLQQATASVHAQRKTSSYWGTSKHCYRQSMSVQCPNYLTRCTQDMQRKEILSTLLSHFQLERFTVGYLQSFQIFCFSQDNLHNCSTGTHQPSNS